MQISDRTKRLAQAALIRVKQRREQKASLSVRDLPLDIRRKLREVARQELDRKYPPTSMASVLEDLGEPYKAPWDWNELPIDDGDQTLSTITTGETLTITQHDGRLLRLTSLHQFPTYAGLLAGVPQANDHSVEHAVTRAAEIFGRHDEPPAIMRPRLRRLPLSRPGSLTPELPSARLPLVTTIAVFDSEPAGDDLAFRSSVIVIWFQESFGMPTDEHVLRQIQDFDWMAHAWDWEP